MAQPGCAPQGHRAACLPVPRWLVTKWWWSRDRAHAPQWLDLRVQCHTSVAQPRACGACLVDLHPWSNLVHSLDMVITKCRAAPSDLVRLGGEEGSKVPISRNSQLVFQHLRNSLRDLSSLLRARVTSGNDLHPCRMCITVAPKYLTWGRRRVSKTLTSVHKRRGDTTR